MHDTASDSNSIHQCTSTSVGCPACKDLEPVWQRLAADLGPGGILVGKIDGTKNRALMTRFSVRHFPSIYHITGVETREYSGRHTLQDLSAFAMGNWKKVEPRTGCASPVSRCGRLYGEIGKLPARGKAKLVHLKCDTILSGRKFSSIGEPTSPTDQNTSATAVAATVSGQPEENKKKKKRKKQRTIHVDPFSLPLPPSAFTSYQGQDQFRFSVTHQSTRSSARVCKIETPHGTITTPGYVPVATNAALKAVDTTVADSLGVELMFCNTYHLMLHPGSETVEQAGGLHSFMSRRRDRPLITDSGGFQAFSLAYGTVHQELHSSLKRKSSPSSEKRTRDGNLVLKISEEGITFRSYRDGTPMLLSPESSISAQKSLAADIILPLDELPPYHISEDILAASVARSHRWEARSLLHHIKEPREQACYGIIHGGSSTELRKASSRYISSLPFDGFAVGGSLGKTSEELFEIMQNVMGWLPRDRPVHVLGIADPINITRLATLGCDTFDSCHATRVGRHGAMLTEIGNLRVAAGDHKSAHRTPVDNCSCPTCTTYSLAYLHHLVKANEPIAATLLSVHNIYFMVEMMKKLHFAILNNEV
ncbi:hypothetical protein KSW81_007350 [Nannochloris sp. 'desiccata']|nr:hypothetical protein KSW81_007350 [Chlorella desiccata (nom. nud.)]